MQLVEIIIDSIIYFYIYIFLEHEKPQLLLRL